MFGDLISLDFGGDWLGGLFDWGSGATEFVDWADVGGNPFDLVDDVLDIGGGAAGGGLGWSPGAFEGSGDVVFPGETMGQTASQATPAAQAIAGQQAIMGNSLAQDPRATDQANEAFRRQLLRSGLNIGGALLSSLLSGANQQPQQRPMSGLPPMPPGNAPSMPAYTPPPGSRYNPMLNQQPQHMRISQGLSTRPYGGMSIF